MISVAVHPNHMRLLTSSSDFEVDVWSLETGGLMAKFTAPYYVVRLIVHRHPVPLMDQLTPREGMEATSMDQEDREAIWGHTASLSPYIVLVHTCFLDSTESI